MHAATLDYQQLVEDVIVTTDLTQYCTAVVILDDNRVELQEYFAITLTTTADYIRFNDSQTATVTIQDTDSKLYRTMIHST